MGVAFLPMVAESSGAWAPEALAVLRQLASASATLSGGQTGLELAKLLQTTSVTIRRAHARAVLRRGGEPEGPAEGALLGARAALDAA